jgi:hypothetical protein
MNEHLLRELIHLKMDEHILPAKLIHLKMDEHISLRRWMIEAGMNERSSIFRAHPFNSDPWC